MNNNKKIFFVLLSLLLVLIFSLIAVYLLFNRDISNKKLGPSPFKVDEIITEENSIEYLKLIEIGKNIIGEDVFNDNEKFQPIDYNNPEPAIVVLQEYIQKNKINLNDETMLLFKEFKPPKPKYENNDPIFLLFIIKYCYRKVMLEILLKDFDSAKRDFIYLKQVNEFNLNKTTGLISGWSLFGSKLIELKIVKLFIDNTNFTIDQKMEILEIQNNPIPSKFIINIMHFEEELLNSTLLDLEKEFIKTQKYGVFQFYILQPNNSVKLLRNLMIEKIKIYESPMSTYKDIRETDKTAFTNIKFYSKNCLGIEFLDKILPKLVDLLANMQKHKNICNQFLIAKEILYFNKKMGVFPQSLEELNLPKEIIIDKFTNEQFLYSAENGILQSVRGAKNDSINLTSIKLSKEEIRRLLNEEKGNDYILYLK